MTGTELLLVADIEPIKGLNPRGDVGGETIDELAASMSEIGMLQPVLVGARNGHKKWPLIAGARRLAAAKKAGLKEIPARVDESLSGRELEAAIAENVHREDLSPVEEARAIRKLRTERGMKQADVAALLGKSERWVRDREKLLELPEKAQAGYDAGIVPLDTLGPVEAVAKVSAPIAEALVMEAAKGKFEPELLRGHHLPTSIEYLIREKRIPKGACLILVSGGSYGLRPAELPVDRKQQAELEQAMKAAPKVKLNTYSGPEGMDRINFGDEAADAAKAYGCLLEVSGDNRHGATITRRYITDPAFLFDRAKVEIEAETKRRETLATEQSAATKKKQGEKLEPGSPEAEADAAAATERAKVRERENRQRVKAHDVNLELGSRLKQNLGRPKFGMTEARLLAELALAHDAKGLAARGAYVDEALLDEKRKQTKAEAEAGKPGTLKVEPVAPATALEALRDEIAAAKTPQALLGILLRHLIAARCSDDVVTVQSRRVGTTTPGVDHEYLDRDKRIAALIDQVALDAGVLPDVMVKAAEKRARDAG